MINKADVLAILEDAKAKVEALEDLGSPDVVELQKKIDELTASLADVSSQLDAAKAVIVSDEAALQADEDKLAKIKEILA